MDTEQKHIEDCPAQSVCETLGIFHTHCIKGEYTVPRCSPAEQVTVILLAAIAKKQGITLRKYFQMI